MENHNSVVIYEEAGKPVEVRLDAGRDTVWLSLMQIAEVFDRDKSAVSRHLNNVFKNKELDRKSAVAKNATTVADGKTYQVESDPANKKTMVRLIMNMLAGKSPGE